MLSGNGRHRRLRQAPAFVVAAGVTGAGIALPLLSAGGAQAADGATWDRVAQCESGGMWAADTGNGYYGGLQLTPEQWEQYGGDEFADRPDYASRAQQIVVAERILDAEGARAFAHCTDGTELEGDEQTPGQGRDSLPPSVIPGSPDPSEEPTESTEPTEPPESTPTESAEPTEKPAEPSESASPSDTPSPSDSPSSPGGARHRGDPAPDPSASTESPDPAAPSDTPGTGKHRKPGAGDGDDRDHDRGSRGAERGDYTVRPGDNLSKIAAERSVRGGWPELYADNKDVVGSDPDLIHPGQRLDFTRN